MAKKLNPNILKLLSQRTKKKAELIRPRLSEIKRKYSGLTSNAAAQIYAQQQTPPVSFMGKLDEEDKKSLASVQSILQVNSSKTVKIDKRTLRITGSPIHNLSFGDRNEVRQTVVTLDNSLAELNEAIEKSPKISPEDKEDYKSDLKSLASQIGKRNPNKEIIKEAWQGLKALATIEGFAQLVERVALIIKDFIS